MELNSFQLMSVEYVIAAIGIFLGIKCIQLKKNNMTFFMNYIFMLDIYLLINIPIRYVELHLVTWNREFVFWLYAASVLLMAFDTYCWFVFVLRQIKSRLIDSKIKRCIWIIPAVIMIPICIINRWTGWLYVIDESSFYHRGSIFVLQALIAYGYVVIMIICNLVSFIFSSDKKASRKFFISFIPAIIGTVLQTIFGGSYFLAGTVICSLIMYVEICLDRQKAYEIEESLSVINDELMNSNKEVAKNVRNLLAVSDIYSVMYDVDMINDTFTEIKSTELVSSFCNRFTSAKECLSKVATEMFVPEDTDKIKEMFNPGTIAKRLEDDNSFFADGRGKHTNSWIRTTIVASERDNSGRVIRCVFMLQYIDELKKQQKRLEDATMIEQHAKEMKELFSQTAMALSGAIDAKDRYTHGHSVRVATYSRRIAKLAGYSEEECEKIYFAGLLHDVGKIGIKNTILNKEGKLTDEEYESIKQHPVLGYQILANITRLPYLSIGAHYHHERYDGKGYPDGLKGEDIPEIARIIAVADAYDAMTSCRSYRKPLDQEKVRSELVRCTGTQFDPDYARYMIQLVDEDKDYHMRQTDIGEI